ncbi:MAG TPA: hypothetical protein VD970_08420, partial [Acetobacteraceae bacterium]|nr:hypothetical protein [Acetobacteraceae bacterium]
PLTSASELGRSPRTVKRQQQPIRLSANALILLVFVAKHGNSHVIIPFPASWRSVARTRQGQVSYGPIPPTHEVEPRAARTGTLPPHP